MSARPLRRPGRTAGTAHLGIALATLAVLLPLLLQAATSSPPTAAEFSPNAQQVIRKAPPGQAADVNGTGEGGTGASPTPTPSASASAGPLPTPPTLEVPPDQIKRCVGPPPLRQTEDPQSPPCKAYWKGDNGGATARGVTRDAVYIAIPTPENAQTQFNALLKHFNNRYQFYGRKLVFEFCSSSGGGSGSSDQKNQVADATLAAAGCGGMPVPFASTFYRQNNGRYYMPAMGCTHKIIAVGSYSPYDKAFMNRCAPYLYQYPMLVDEEFANIGEWACARLVGRKAQWADGNDTSTPPRAMSTLTRRIGIVLEPFTDDDPVARRSSLAPMLSRLHACGYDVKDEDILVNPVASNNFEPSQASNAMLQLKTQNVTTVICMCNFFSFGNLARAAETNAYHPEWATGTFGLNDVNSSFTLSAAPDSQLANMFGVTFQPRIVSPLLNAYNVALADGDPTVAPDTASTGEAKLEVYRALLVLASGIQMAGPKLTVQTFRDGLRSARYPNPFIPALNAGAIDIRPDGYSFTADAAEWWWGVDDVGPFSDSAAKRGTVCYVDHGRRRTLGAWPKGAPPFFTGRCDSGA